MDFLKFAELHGLIIDRLVEGKWMRVKTVDKPKHRNGAYRFMGDVGFLQNHATMDEVAVWKPEKPMDATQQASIGRRIATQRADEARERLKAIDAMRAHYSALPPLRGGHPYLEAKALTMRGCTGLKVDGALLVIPVLRAGALISFQTITPDGAKKFRYGCPVKGGTYLLGRPGAVVTCLVEGFATGLAVFQCIPNANVVVTFDAGNLVEVAKTYKGAGLMVVCADNDWQTAERIGSNPGVDKGRAAANALGCGLAVPQGIEGSDWADLMVERGVMGPRTVQFEVMKGARQVMRY